MIKPAPSLWRPLLKKGMRGHDVAAWQEVQRYERRPEKWPYEWPIAVDGFFGDHTDAVTRVFQSRRALVPVDGIVGKDTRAAINPLLFDEPIPFPGDLPPIPYIPAKYWQWADRKAVDIIVLHAAEDGEYFNSAEAIASYFKLGPPKPASAHYIVDLDSIIQSVKDEHIAYHAPPNERSIGIEQAGYSKQTRDEWLDEYGQRMLKLVARLVAFEARKWSIPLAWLTVAELKAGGRGLCTHVDVTQAFHQTTHTDPGPNYPKDVVLDWAKAA